MVSQTVERYSLVSASDCPNRYPRRWELWGQRAGAKATQWEQLHAVPAAPYPGPSQRVDYDVTDPDIAGVLFSAVQLRILASQKRGEGLQLAQLFLSTKSLRTSAAVAWAAGEQQQSSPKVRKQASYHHIPYSVSV